MSRRHRMSSKAFGALPALAAVLVLASTATANGRFPRGQRLVESESDKNLLALFGTYGLMVSRDAGRSWNHVCEGATGKYGGEDPLLEILPDSRVVARTDAALVRSDASRCNWTDIRGGTDSTVQDITRSSTDPLSILALLGSYSPTAG